MSLPIPEQGLRYVMSAWTGEGVLARAIAAVEDEATSHHTWSEVDVRRRAHRLTFEHIRTALANWPRRGSIWLDVLPVISTSRGTRAQHPFPGVNWAETLRRGGFPPKECFGRTRERAQDSTLLSTLRWTIDRLLEVAADARRTGPEVTRSLEDQLAASVQLVASGRLAGIPGELPGNVELAALRREGSPWGSVANVAAGLRLLEGDASSIALELLSPDPEIRWRLFHLGVLGECLLALKANGCTVTSVRPISGGFAGPAFTAIDARGKQWDVWFEAAGSWSHAAYGRTEPYRAFALGARLSYRPLGPDIMIADVGGKVLVIECKFGDADYVCRNGYLQAVAYAVEAREFAPSVAAFVVGPEGCVGLGTTETLVGAVTIGTPAHIHDIIRDIIK